MSVNFDAALPSGTTVQTHNKIAVRSTTSAHSHRAPHLLRSRCLETRYMSDPEILNACVQNLLVPFFLGKLRQAGNPLEMFSAQCPSFHIISVFWPYNLLAVCFDSTHILTILISARFKQRSPSFVYCGSTFELCAKQVSWNGRPCEQVLSRMLIMFSLKMPLKLRDTTLLREN